LLIEVFFKQIKQTLQLADFLGNSANAVRWQVWTALLTYVLSRFCAWLSQWRPQLHPALCVAALGPVGKNSNCAACLKSVRQPVTAAGFWTCPSKPIQLMLWDSRFAHSQKNSNMFKLNFIWTSRFLRK